jgi:cytochrome oxidase Cu insertion factor (SCO1/SenC/PrrC family)
MTSQFKRIVALTTVVGAMVSAAAGQMKQPMLGEPAPGFELEAVNGDPVSLESLRGKLVVIHIAASW